MSAEGPAGLRAMLVGRRAPACRITYRDENGRCPKCGRRLVPANTRSGWRHER